jgi:2-oxoisovalerate dehydrogenase E1 component beta subunit
MPEVTLVDAINLALAPALVDDPDVVVFGEDVGVNGGVFRATAGLQQRFGAERVFDTPLSEALIAGLCVGMAAQGLKPVGEIQFMGFLYPCIDQLVNHASGSVARWFCARRMARAFVPLNIIRKRLRRCSLTSPACAW